MKGQPRIASALLDEGAPHHILPQMAKDRAFIRQVIQAFYFRQRRPKAKVPVPVDIQMGGPPHVPKEFTGWKSHVSGGKFRWNPLKIHALSPADIQFDEGGSVSDFVRKVSEEGLANANLLDFFLTNREYILPEWNGCEYIFGGTIYEGETCEDLYRGLYHTTLGWDWLCIPATRKVTKDHRVLVLSH